MIWKLYFWFYLVYSVFGLVGILFLGNSLNLTPLNAVINLVIILMLVFGLFVYAFEKKTLSSKIWKSYLLVIVVLWVASLIIDPVHDQVWNIVISLALDLPAFFAIYQLTRLHK